MVKPIICCYLAINEKHKYHTFGTVQKFIRKIAERYNIDIPCTQIHDRSLSLLGTDSSIKGGGVKLVLKA